MVIVKSVEKARGVAVTVAGRHGKGVGVVLASGEARCGVVPDAEITDDNIRYPALSFWIQVYCGTRSTVPLIVGVLSLVSPRC